jgi:hypothetical protein
MAKYITTKKITVYKVIGNKYEPTGQFIPQNTVINGVPVTVQTPPPVSNTFHFIQISGFGKSGTPTYVFPSDVKPYGVESKSKNGASDFLNEEQAGTMKEFGKSVLMFVITLAILFATVYVISRAWKRGQNIPVK